MSGPLVERIHMLDGRVNAEMVRKRRENSMFDPRGQLCGLKFAL